MLELQHQVDGVHVSDALLDYLQALLEFTRQSPQYRNGLSPRAGLALLQSARAWAFLSGRDLVLPEDVQTVLPAVVNHRLHPGDEHTSSLAAAGQASVLLESVAVP